jgi:hypothetical protein
VLLLLAGHRREQGAANGQVALGSERQDDQEGHGDSEQAIVTGWLRSKVMVQVSVQVSDIPVKVEVKVRF